MDNKKGFIQQSTQHINNLLLLKQNMKGYCFNSLDLVEPQI